MTTQTSPLKWYVLYTRPKFEGRISEEIGTMHYESYVPVRMVKRQWSDRIKQICEPLFMNYVFVHTDIRYKADILQIPGVVRFVSFQNNPAVLPSEEIQRIRLIESNCNTLEKESYFTQGERVWVKSGPFAGMEGTLLSSVDSYRFIIRLPLLQQAVSVEISIDDIAKVHHAVRA